TQESGCNRRRGRLHDGKYTGRSRFEENTATCRRAVIVARHECTDALQRVGRDPAAVAQPAGKLAVIDGATTEGRFGEPARAAEFTDLLNDLLVHGAFPDRLSMAAVVQSEPTPATSVNHKYVAWEDGQDGWANRPPNNFSISSTKIEALSRQTASKVQIWATALSCCRVLVGKNGHLAARTATRNGPKRSE